METMGQAGASTFFHNPHIQKPPCFVGLPETDEDITGDISFFDRGSAMKHVIATAAVMALTGLAAASGASAQSWQGPYGSLLLGSNKVADGSTALSFDTNLDGKFGDTVNTFTNTDYFAPGFCSGIAATNMPAGGCSKAKGQSGVGARIGYDWETNHIVYGVLLDIIGGKVTDGVSGFSTAPDSYVFSRKISSITGLRGRVGYDYDGWLGYVTAGLATADISRGFATTNPFNTFNAADDSGGNGTQIGLGVEKMVTKNWSVGVEYLRTSLRDQDPTVRASGSSSTFASNPFLIANAQGTDIRRNDDRFKIDTVLLTVSYRFGAM